MKAGSTMTPEQRERVSAATRAAMADPMVRAKISARTIAGMHAATSIEWRRLEAAWTNAGPDVRRRFLHRFILSPVCSASGSKDPDARE